MLAALLLTAAVASAPGIGEIPIRDESPADRSRALLELVVNTVPKGEALVELDGSDVWIDVDALSQAGFNGLAGERRRSKGREFVSLSSLAPDLAFELDAGSLVLRITARPELLGTTVVARQTGHPPDLVYRQNTSAFLNYAINGRGRATYDLFSEAGVSAHGALAVTTFSRRAGQAVLRGLTSVTVDDRRRMTRWIVGDTFSNTGVLGGAALVGGIGIRREYTIDPYFIRFPTLNLTGSVTTPSTVEVYVNDKLVRREQLPPGQFDMSSFPVPTGRGETRMVIRDAFGREQQISSPYYLTSTILARGLQEFAYTLGFRRDEVADRSWEYGQPMLFARHRIGVTDHVTVGFRAEADHSTASGGPLLSGRLPFGEFEIEGAVSSTNRLPGWAASGGYAYISRAFSAGASVRGISPHYSHLSLRPTDERSRIETSGFAGLQLGSRTSLTVQQFRTSLRGTPAQGRTSLLTTTRIATRADLFVNLGRTTDSGHRLGEFFTGVNYYFGNRTSGGISYERRGSEGSPVAELQRSPGIGTGYGYRMRYQSGESDLSSGSLLYQGQYGRYELRYEGIGNQQVGGVNIAGAIVGIGNGVYFTRPVEQSYALVQVPGVKGVRTFVSNQEVGRTGRSGNLLVPDLISYYGNRLAIADEDVPMSHAVPVNQQTIAPPFRGGAMVTFPVSRIQAATGRIVLQRDGQRQIPSYGNLTVGSTQNELRSPLGHDGDFYLDNLPPGHHRATVNYQGADCAMTVDMPESDLPIVNLGTLTCSGPQEPPQ